ncbi:hypothetical protein SNEBB_011128 [Seison nebaliae]|nr:hypothetical protein SNEBB_011128 [Seison nebaliae]
MVKELGNISSILGTVLSAGDYVDKTKGESKEAVKYQKFARRKQVIVTIIVAVVAAIIVGIVIAVEMGKNKK